MTGKLIRKNHVSEIPCISREWCFVSLVLALMTGSFSIGTAAALSAMPSSVPSVVIADWERQDNVTATGYDEAASVIIANLPPDYAAAARSGLSKRAAGTSPKQTYLEVAHLRRLARLAAAGPRVQKILCAKHFDLGGTIIGFIEDLRGDRYSSPVEGAKFNFPAMSRGSSYKSGSALLVVELTDGAYGSPKVLLDDDGGVIRDPCLSYDGQRVAFAWSKDNNGYHIWELDIASGETTQLTDDPDGLTVSDFEPCYLPNGDILFNSSRCFGQVDCNFNITCNLYLMNGEGKYLRQVGFDQVHTFYPTMMSTGKVLYCRWEYNDRNVSNVFGIFSMNIDGSHQTEYFGNQTSVPATLNQAREIPGTDGKVLATTGGHMGMYCGDLCVVDPNLGRNGKASCQLVAPKREWPASAGMDGVPEETKLFQNPYPIDAQWFLISYRPDVSSKYGIYLMNLDGERELIASDADMSLSQPVPLVERELPPITAYQADYTRNTGVVTMSNAYFGNGTNANSSTQSVRAGSIDKIRVIAIEYRIPPWFGNVGESAYTCTPVARWMGSWEAKRIVGEMQVESDGSSAFIVPARVPLYFQLIDNDGCAINSMRSWTTLQPGEKFSCYGCHEDKNIAPPPIANPIASNPKPLEPFYEIEDHYFSFPKYIQPILDNNCVACHTAGHESGLDLSGDTFWTGDLTNDVDNNTACRYWSKAYYNLTAGSGFMGGTYVNYITVMSGANGLRPNSFGSGRSELISRLTDGHADLTKEEMDKLCAWIDLCIPYSGHYTEGMRPSDSAAYRERFEETRGAHQRVEAANIEEWIASGQYKVPPYQTTSVDDFDNRHALRNSRRGSINLVRFRMEPDGRYCTINVPCAGTLILTDLSGRRIMRQVFSGQAVNTQVSIPLKKTLPKGLYLVRYTGGTVYGIRTVTIL